MLSRHAGACELLFRVPPLRGQDRQAAQALDAAEARRALEDLQPIEKARGALVAAADVDAHHPAEAAHLPAPRSHDPDAARGRDSRPRSTRRSRRQPAGDRHRVRVVPFHPHRRASSARARARTRHADRARCRVSCAHRESGPSDCAGPASAPAVTSLWPFRYFVALCITRSTPSAIGCWLIGLANVLSTTEMTPRARHARATAAMSTQRSVGLIGDSNQTSFVASEKIDSGRASSSSDTNRGWMPNFGSRSAEQMQRAAVDRRAAHDFVARRRQRHQRGRRRRLPARQHAAPLRPLRARQSSARPASTVGFA